MRALLATALLGLSLAAHAGRYELVIDEGRVNQRRACARR